MGTIWTVVVEDGVTSLAEARKQRYMSVLELAKAAKVGHTTIQRIETGRVIPHLKTRRQLAAALGLAPDAIEWPETEWSGEVESDDAQL